MDKVKNGNTSGCKNPMNIASFAEAIRTSKYVYTLIKPTNKYHPPVPQLSNCLHPHHTHIQHAAYTYLLQNIHNGGVQRMGKGRVAWLHVPLPVETLKPTLYDVLITHPRKHCFLPSEKQGLTQTG
jgi:hypothetical protein